MDLRMSMKISGTALNANRTKMNVIAENLANAETTRTAEGGPYRRKMVVLKAKTLDGFKNMLGKFMNKSYVGVQVAEIIKSQEEPRLVYNPRHPDADPATGYVAMPNIDHLTEIADMIVARRAYDANAAAIANTRSMIKKALEIGK